MNENHLLTLTTALQARIEALGYVPGETPAGVLPWLVELAEEARLTLAAEQGRQEGAPSEGWSFETMCLRDFWTKTYEDGSVAIVQDDGSWMRGAFSSGSPTTRGKADHQRAAMVAADKANNPPTTK